jgi:hypothetical protein
VSLTLAVRLKAKFGLWRFALKSADNVEPLWDQFQGRQAPEETIGHAPESYVAVILVVYRVHSTTSRLVPDDLSFCEAFRRTFQLEPKQITVHSYA